MLNKKALAGTPSTPPVYVEDVFSTYLYTGNGSSQTITNGIDLSGKGGLVWTKSRGAAISHRLVDTVRAGTLELSTDSTAAQSANSGGLTSFGSTGYTIGSGGGYNNSAGTYCSWTFREQAKFFDVVTYTGNGSNRTIAHNLGSVPGMIIVKRTDTTGDWQVYHRSLANTEYLVLNTTAAKATGATRWNSTTPTSTEFSLGTDATVNANTGTYVAYLFAHDAGGFGAAGTDNVISCGSFTGNTTVNLGYEPQYVLLKNTSTAENWFVVDVMRGWNMTNANTLSPNTSASESDLSGGGGGFNPTATGFYINYVGSSNTYIYMAIRRPMKTPTSGTQVFSPITSSDTTGTTQTTGFPIDLQVAKYRAFTFTAIWSDRLRGVITTPTDANSPTLESANTTAEASPYVATRYFNNTGFQTPTGWSGSSVAFWNFRRAPGFFDVVCYTGTGSATTQTHNLGVAPELMIIKRRNTTAHWMVYAQPLGNTSRLLLSSSNGESTGQTTVWNSTSPTSSVFSLGTSTDVNASGSTYVAYLFATLNGISKVGSYTGNGSNQTINCGFTAGARFVLIKRTDSTGDWCVFDTARGIVSGNDPFLQLNTADAEVTGEDAVDPTNSGFIVNETTEALNTNNATYIYLAIA